jgi:hypothetical protein
VCYLFYHWKKEKLLSPKFDTLQNHVGCWKEIVAMINVIVGEWCYNKDATYNKMKGSILKSNSGQEFVLTMVQFASTFHLQKNIDHEIISFVKSWSTNDKIQKP